MTTRRIKPAAKSSRGRLSADEGRRSPSATNGAASWARRRPTPRNQPARAVDSVGGRGQWGYEDRGGSMGRIGQHEGEEKGKECLRVTSK